MIATYKDIHRKLNKFTDSYLKGKKDAHIKQFINNQKYDKRTGFENKVIPVVGIDEIRDSYIEEYSEPDEIGTIDPCDQEYEIKYIALLALMSNRLSKAFKQILENQELDKDTKEKIEDSKDKAYAAKDEAMSYLISSIYVLEKTGGDEYKDKFCYGNEINNRNDEDAENSFLIDIPFLSQISLHYGKDENKEDIINNAKAQVKSILNRKIELGQIDKQEVEKIISEMETDGVNHDYEGVGYEYVGGLPTEDLSYELEEKRKEMGLANVLPEDIGIEEIKKISRSGLNAREMHYLAVKLRI